MERFVRTQTVYSFDVDELHKKYREGNAVFVENKILGCVKVCFIISIKEDKILLSYYDALCDEYDELFVTPEDFYNKKIELFCINFPDSQKTVNPPSDKQLNDCKFNPFDIDEVTIHQFEEFTGDDYNQDKYCIVKAYSQESLPIGEIVEAKLVRTIQPGNFCYIDLIVFTSKPNNIVYAYFPIIGEDSKKKAKNIRNGIYNKITI